MALTDLHSRLLVVGLLAVAAGGEVHLCDATTPREREQLALHALTSWSEARAPAAWELVRVLEQTWLPAGVVTRARPGRYLCRERTNDAMRRALGRLLVRGEVQRIWHGPRQYGSWRWSVVS